MDWFRRGAVVCVLAIGVSLAATVSPAGATPTPPTSAWLDANQASVKALVDGAFEESGTYSGSYTALDTAADSGTAQTVSQGIEQDLADLEAMDSSSLTVDQIIAGAGTDLAAGTALTTLGAAGAGLVVGYSVGSGINHYLHVSCHIDTWLGGTCGAADTYTVPGDIYSSTYTPMSAYLPYGFDSQDWTTGSFVHHSGHYFVAGWKPNATITSPQLSTPSCSRFTGAAGNSNYAIGVTSSGATCQNVLTCCDSATFSPVDSHSHYLSTVGALSLLQHQTKGQWYWTAISHYTLSDWCLIDNETALGGGSSQGDGCASWVTPSSDFRVEKVHGSSVTTTNPGGAITVSAPSPTSCNVGSTCWTNMKATLTGDPNTGAWVQHAIDPGTYPFDPSYPTFVLPQPAPNETYTAYTTRLAALGYLGTSTEHDLSTADPLYGPSAPTRVQYTDQAGTVHTLDPLHWPTSSPRVGTSAAVSIYVNPTTATPAPTDLPPTSTDAGTIPPAGGIDFTPITSLSPGCSFPFGLFCYAHDVTEWFNVTAAAPDFTFTIPGVHIGSTYYGASSYTYDVNLSGMNTYMSWIRALIAIAIWVGAVYYVAAKFLGFHAGGDPGEAMDEAL